MSAIIRYNLDVYVLGAGIAAAVVYGLYRLLALLIGVGLGLVNARPKSKLA